MVAEAEAAEGTPALQHTVEQPGEEGGEKPEETATADAHKVDGTAPDKEHQDATVKVEWPYEQMDTLDADEFYRDVGRAGIEYGPNFRMLLKRHIDGRAAVLRCRALACPFYAI
jgi:fatty acid synthase